MTAKFPVDAPRAKVIATLQSLGFRLVRQGNHIAIKSSTLRTICTQARIPREDFLAAYQRLR